MFNSNIPATALLSIEGSGLGAHTPKTPEILNSLIAMTSPLDNLFNPSNSCSAASTPVVTIRNFGGNPNGQVCTAYPLPFAPLLVPVPPQTYNLIYPFPFQLQSHSQDSSHSSCSASPLDSPAGTASTPSVQQVRGRGKIDLQYINIWIDMCICSSGFRAVAHAIDLHIPFQFQFVCFQFVHSINFSRQFQP